MRRFLPVLIFAVALIPVVAVQAGASRGSGHAKQVQIPDEDRFTPFAIVIHAGDVVRWTNGDSDDHTVVSDDPFNTAGHKGTDHLLEPDGTFVLKFNHPGTFVYYCRLHAHLDEYGQPVAPGPDGGIQDENGNYGTPMSGVVTVLP